MNIYGILKRYCDNWVFYKKNQNEANPPFEFYHFKEMNDPVLKAADLSV